MLYSEIIAVCSQIHTKHINTLCGQNVEFLNVKLVVHVVTIWALVSVLDRFRDSAVQNCNRKERASQLVSLLELYEYCSRVNTLELSNQNKFLNTGTTDRDILHPDVRDFDLSWEPTWMSFLHSWFMSKNRERQIGWQVGFPDFPAIAQTTLSSISIFEGRLTAFFLKMFSV